MASCQTWKVYPISLSINIVGDFDLDQLYLEEQQAAQDWKQSKQL